MTAAGQAEPLDLSWAEDNRVFPRDPAWSAQMMVASLRRRIVVGSEKFEEAVAEDDLMAVAGISTMIDHLRTQLDEWERNLRELNRARFRPVASQTGERVTVRQPLRRLDRNLGCGRPAARRASASSASRDGPDPDLGDEPPGHRPPAREAGAA